ncbi:MAG: ABC transporter substrate-binding protein [archaeon]
MKKKSSTAINIVIFVVLVSAAFFAISISSEKKGSGQEPSLKEIRVGVSPLMVMLPIFVADNQSLFEKHGLRAELIEFQTSASLFEALITGKIDVAGGSSVEYHAISSKDPTYLIPIYMNYNDISFISVRKDSDMKNISDLNNKRIAVTPDHGTFQMNAIAGNAGLDGIETVKLRYPDMMAALLADKVDAILVIDPMKTAGETSNVSRELVANPYGKYIYDPWLGGIGVIRSEFKEENPEAARAIIDAIGEAIDYYRLHETEALSILPDYIPISHEVALKAAAPRYWKPDEIEWIKVEGFSNALYDLGVLDSRVDFGKVLKE